MYHIIINPASRSGRGRKIWHETIQPALDKQDISYNAYFSEKPGDVSKLAANIVQSSLSKPCRLIILGGDGTVNEALQGIPPHSDVIIGYIPTGSSNDLARDMNLKKAPLEALALILSATHHPERIHSMDRGIVKYDGKEHSFAVSCGIGFDAAVCAEAMQSRFKDTLNRFGLGKLTYWGIALKQLFTAKSVSCSIYPDEKPPVHIKKFLFTAAMNHRFEGGGFKFAPKADYADGIFDLCAVGGVPKPVILFALPTAFFGKHFLFKGVDAYTASHILIQTSAPLALHTDGEYLGKVNKLEISCIPKDIHFIA